jgi:hypothetical protein
MSDLNDILIIKRDEQEDQEEIKKIDRFLMMGLLFIIIVVPLVVRLKMIDFTSPTLSEFEFLNSGKKADVFTYYKKVILVGMTVILSLCFLYKVYILNYKMKNTKLNIILSLLLVSIVTSTLLSSEKTIALFGMYNRSEGALTYICYIVLLFIAANITYSERAIKWFLYGLFPFTIINTVLGLLNFYGYNVLENNFVTKLVYSSLPKGVSISEGSRLLATINQWNYVSGISALLFTVFFTYLLLEKKLISRIIATVLLLMSFAMLLSSLSSSGFFTICITVPLVFILLILKKNLKAVLLGVCVLVLCITVYIPMVKHDPKVWDETFGIVFSENIFLKKESAISYLKNNISFTNLAYAEEEDKGFRLPILPEPKYSWGTGRSYIWKNTLLLIEKKPLFGYGLDTFVFHFPQYDVNKLSGLASHDIITDKPHSIYIGIAYGLGITGLLLFFILIINFIFKTIKSQLLRDELFKNRFFISLTMGILAFLIQGLFNDSIIGTSIIFFVILGVLHSKVYSLDSK